MGERTMNIVNKLTLRHMKTNRGRTIVTTLGIAAAVALITAIFVSLASFLDMTGEICLYSSGKPAVGFGRCFAKTVR